MWCLKPLHPWLHANKAKVHPASKLVKNVCLDNSSNLTQNNIVCNLMLHTVFCWALITLRKKLLCSDQVAYHFDESYSSQKIMYFYPKALKGQPNNSFRDPSKRPMQETHPNKVDVWLGEGNCQEEPAKASGAEF